MLACIFDAMLLSNFKLLGLFALAFMQPITYMDFYVFTTHKMPPGLKRLYQLWRTFTSVDFGTLRVLEKSQIGRV